MINIVPIIIDERGSVKKDIQILAMENENLSKRFSILLPNSLIGKWLYIEFEKEDGAKFVSPKLEVINGYIQYDLGIDLLDQAGKLICQVVAKDEHSVIWKSNKFDFKIPSSINATEKVAAENPDILADLYSILIGLEKDIKTITGIDGGHLATDEDIRVLQTRIEEINSTINNLDTNYATDADIERLQIAINELRAYVDNLVGAGGGTSIPIVEISGSNITLEPNKHYVIKGVTNSLTISLSQPITTELKHYSFEFATIDRIPKVTINGVDQPYNYEYAKYTKYLCEIVNNHLVILGAYDGFEYQFVYGLYASSDWVSSYTLKNDRTFIYTNGGNISNGTYKVEYLNNAYMITLTFEDSNIEIATYSNDTITINGATYTRS